MDVVVKGSLPRGEETLFTPDEPDDSTASDVVGGPEKKLSSDHLAQPHEGSRACPHVV